MKEFEYYIKHVDSVLTREELNILGKEGWELIQILSITAWTYYFKREIVIS